MIDTVNSPIAVLGAGSFGTALAILLAKNGQSVRLWGHEPNHVKELQARQSNERYLPGIALPNAISLYTELAATLQDIQDILIVVPSKAFADVLKQIKPLVDQQVRLVWGTKGLDPQSGDLLHTVVSDIFGEQTPLAAIAGPSIAKEVALGLPTAVTAATNNDLFAQDLVKRFMNNTFRVYTTSDVIGVEICGLVKNILAIATGIVDGLKLGSNAVSAFITRGLAEMTRLGLALGSMPQTFMGLAGVGDLILTCTSSQSRNRRFGAAIVAGKSIEQALQEINQVVEGLSNLKSVLQLAKKHGVDMPITQQVYRVLFEGLSPQLAMATLFARDPKSEVEWPYS